MWDHNWTAETRVSKYPQHPLRRAPVTMPEPWRAVGGRLAGGWQAVGGRDECGATAAGQCAGSGAVREAWCTHGGPYRWCVGVGRCVSGGEGGGWRAVGGRLVGGWRGLVGGATAPGLRRDEAVRTVSAEASGKSPSSSSRCSCDERSCSRAKWAVSGRLAGGWRAVGGRLAGGTSAARRLTAGARAVGRCARLGVYAVAGIGGAWARAAWEGRVAAGRPVYGDFKTLNTR